MYQNKMSNLFNVILQHNLVLFIFFSFGINSLGLAHSININPLNTGLNSSYLGLEDASLSDQAFSHKRTPGRKAIYINYYWDRSPWVILSEDKKSKVDTVVSSLNVLDIGFSWLLDDHMQVGFETFGAIVSVDENYGGESSTHMGDSRLQFKYRFLTETNWSMAIAPEIIIPTGVEYTGHQYGASLSNSSFAPSLRLMGEYKTTETQWVFNLGYSYFDKAEFKSSSTPNQDYPRIDGRSRLFIGSGSLIRLSKKWGINTEFTSQIPAGTNHFTPPGLFTFGARYQPAKTISWDFGLGSGALGQKASGNDSLIYIGAKIPLFSGALKNQPNNPIHDNDPLLEEAYKKELIDRSSNKRKLDPRELEPYRESEVPEDNSMNSNFYNSNNSERKLLRDR